MTVDLYLAKASAPCRAVWMLLKYLGVDHKLIELNLMTGEQKKPEYIKLNPNGSVPTLVDDGFVVYESRAVLMYIGDKYGSSKTGLYPTDPKKRSVINRFLFYDMGTLYKTGGEWLYPQVLRGEAGDDKKLAALDEKMAGLDKMLDGKKFLTGDDITIADFSLAGTVTFFSLKDYDLSKYKNVQCWLDNLKAALPFWDECLQGLAVWKASLK